MSYALPTPLAAASTDTDKFVVDDNNVFKYRTGAQVLSDIGGVGGSGTVNNVPKLTAATTLGNSQISDDGTDVFISKSLHIGATSGAAGDNNILADGRIISDSTTDATSTTDGSIQTDGGISAAKRVYAGGRITTDDTTDATSTTDGSIQTDGGLSVVKRIVAGDDVAVLADNKNVELGAGSDMAMYYDGINGNIDTDLVAPSDLTIDCGTDKTLVLEETVWDDMRVVPGSFDRPGVTDPTIVAYDVNGGGTSTYLWQFQKNAIASFTVQLPHGYKTGTDIYAHIHWTPGANGVTENGNTVGWKIEYSWANINSNFATMASLDLSDACDGTDHKHQMTPDVVITGTSKSISSMLICNIKRTDTGADDTWSGTASGSLPMLLEIDFHFEIDTIGSRQRTAK